MSDTDLDVGIYEFCLQKCSFYQMHTGFGDFVPAQGAKENPELSIAFCSLYLLFGIALLAMSFNLVQEEVITNVKNVARQLGILKEEEVYY